MDLLLHGLGELGFWRSWRTSVHLSRCTTCRRTQRELVSTSARMASALRQPGSRPRAPHPPVSVLHGWLALIGILVGLTLLMVTGKVVIDRMTGSTAVTQDIPCRPDLPNDKCR